MDEVKILFVDVDNVLNCDTTTERFMGYVGIDKRLWEIFRCVLERVPNLKIVLHSTWRGHDPFRNFFKEWLKKSGMFDRYIGCTGITDQNDLSGYKSQEIEAYFRGMCNPTPPKFAVIDDDPRALKFCNRENAFLTHERWGITEEIANNIVKYFNECSCPSVACKLHGLPPGSASGVW